MMMTPSKHTLTRAETRGKCHQRPHCKVCNEFANFFIYTVFVTLTGLITGLLMVSSGDLQGQEVITVASVTASP